MNIIIGANGVKRSGKDTLGKMVGEYCEKRCIPFQRLSFADEIRVLAMESMPEPFKNIINMDELKGEGKIDRDIDNIFEMVGISGYDHFKYAVEWIDKFIERVKQKHGYELTSYLTEIPELVTIRDVLVIFGTEIGRDLFFYNIWIDIVRKQFNNFDGVSVVTDVRFDNEAETIKSNNGYVINVVKPDITQTSEHRSEQGISEHLIDYTIVNKHGELDNFRIDVEHLMGGIINV